MEIVDRAGRANGGICLDTWHHFRGANDDRMLWLLPVERIFAVQFNDGPRRPVDPDYYTDCTRYRDVPGEGEFDLAGFLALIADKGVRLPTSVEVMSTALLRRPAQEIAGLLHDRTRAFVERAAARRGPA